MDTGSNAPGRGNPARRTTSHRTRTPVVGVLVKDTATSRTGEYRDVAGGRWLLRPVGGGREWEAAPENVRPASLDEQECCQVDRQ
ncbi:hypothetical protein [Streptomyces sp. NPDC017529]|uniref:hypothetical protein n=1 Tax=Streptomyces sp. NPDC017529 TaxID=3365000 RepID=UPI003790E952